MLDAEQQLTVAEGLRGGRVEAWTALYDAHSEDVWRYAARLLGRDRESVADVIQETFLAAAKSARSFDPQRGTLRSWLLGIVHTQALQHFRRSARAKRDRDMINSMPTGCVLADPAVEMLQREQGEYVRRTLADMPADYASLLVAKYVDDQPIAAIGAELSLGAEAVRSKLARARRLFRTAMSRERVAPAAMGKKSP